MKNKYEELGGTYREENGYLVPDIEFPKQKESQDCVPEGHRPYLTTCNWDLN